jgi:hypothetical protein
LDIRVVIYEPQAASRIPRGPDGKRIGIFLLHGGVSDFKSVKRVGKLLPEKFGIKVASMTLPVRFFSTILLERMFADFAATPFSKTLPVINGGVEVPQRPGLGGDPENDLIAQYRVSPAPTS